MVKVKTLRPLQIYVIMVVQNKHLSQTWTLKPIMNLQRIHHHERVTPIRRPKSAILLPKFFRKTNVIILEAVITTNAPIPITQKYTDNDLRKKLFQPLGCAILTLHLYSVFHFFCTLTHHLPSFRFEGNMHQKT